MKKLILSLLLTVSINYIAKAQFSENIGTGTASTIAAYSGWQNAAGYTFSGSVSDIRATTASSTYSGASAGSNVYLPANQSATFIIAGINTSLLTNPAISFGLYKSINASDATELTFEYSTNGGTSYSAIPIPAQPTGTGTSNWRLITLTGLPVSASLSIKFTNTTVGTVAFRLDDFHVNSLSVLPVSLTSFAAKANLQNVYLTWTTTSEKDNSHFDILRSGDGKSFSKVGEVAGAGTTDLAKSYAFTDKNALPGTSYYQLRQVDNDGKTTLSEIVSVKSNVAASNFKVASNRQGGNVRLTVFAANEGKATFKIYDLNGRKLVVQELTLNKGYSNISIPFNGGTGLHIASLTTANETATQKFIQ